MNWLGVDLANASGWTVFIAFAIAVMTMVVRGTLVPRRFYKDLIEERDAWKLTAKTEADTVAELTNQLRESSVTLRANAAFLAALPRVEEGH